MCRRRGPVLERQDRWLIAIMASFALYGMACAWFDGQGTGGWDKPSRFLLAVPALLRVLCHPPRLAWLWSGLAVGALGAGSWAAWQKLLMGVPRAGGFTHTIQFGNLSMLMGGCAWPVWAGRCSSRIAGSGVVCCCSEP